MPIKAGDLVVVARPAACSCGDVGLGTIFQVLRVQRDNATCMHCGWCDRGAVMAVQRDDHEQRRTYGVQTWRLRRLDPDPTPVDELEPTTEDCA